jgi:GMP synthase-like glutamine amidotransferase
VKVLAVTHGPDVGPELLGDVVREQGHELVEWDIRVSGAPTVDADAVIVLGGSQNVGEELQHPWLREEYDALRRWVAAGTPLLGVCLGAETLAHATGGWVAALPAQLTGFYDTELTPAGLSDPVLGALPARFDALNANAFGYSVPPGGVLLARSGAVEQAFRVGECAWGVQFHPEVRGEQVLGWFREDGALTDELTTAVDAGLPRWQELGRRLGEAFLSAATR